MLAAASIPFGFVAGWLASGYIPGESLRVLFAILLLYFSARMFEVKFGALLGRGAAKG